MPITKLIAHDKIEEVLFTTAYVIFVQFREHCRLYCKSFFHEIVPNI